MSAAAVWEDVVRAALLGTERQAAAEVRTGDPALDAALAALADRPAEARLLGSAALLDAWRRAGQRALQIAARPAEPAPEDGRPCSPLAARVLRQLLASGPPAVLAEWMMLARRAEAAIPHELLPEVLDYARRHAEVRDDVVRTLGARGRWLAALNPAWSFAADVAEDPAAAWDTGTADERVRMLRAVRASDPAAGLALLRTTWDTDAPKDRAAFVEALQAGLGMDDEPFLEAALDDKRKEVRTAAAQLLATLPRSGLVRRMTERLVPLLTLREPEGLVARIRNAQPRIEVQLPEKCDKGMRRDGIEPKPAYGIGERAWWLRQMLAAVPPAFWTAHWRRSAADLLAAARASEDGGLLIHAWTDAALYSRDAEWGEALLRTLPGDQGAGAVPGLAAALPPERVEAVALERLAERRLTGNGPAARLLEAAGHPWSAALTRAVLAAVPNLAALPDRDRSILGSRLNSYALFMHPAAAVAVLRERGDPFEGPWVDLLHFRHTLHQAFE